MASVLQGLMNSVDVAKEKLSDAEDARDSFLEPILRVLGATGGGISYCSIEQGELHVNRTGSYRGNRWDNDYKFPLEIFTCGESLRVAAEYVAAKKKAKEDVDRRSKLAEIQRLQKELGADL